MKNNGIIVKLGHLLVMFNFSLLYKIWRADVLQGQRICWRRNAMGGLWFHALLYVALLWLFWLGLCYSAITFNLGPIWTVLAFLKYGPKKLILILACSVARFQNSMVCSWERTSFTHFLITWFYHFRIIFCTCLVFWL